MTTITNDLELYAVKGNVDGGKILLFSRLENQKLNKEQIEELVVNEYSIMRPQHFIRSWKDYQKMKRFMNYDTNR
tara:strand:- start:904 stop:1128 length:225 start_codon:yes stop_codon:yes gene_type:complete